jgi:argonaute-like protein implicated in RNA metabolism and viral defense
MRDAVALYKRQNENRLPSRIVLHKSSRFTDQELRGFKDGCGTVPHTDFVTLGWRGIQFHRPGIYPPLRGMYVKFDDRNFLLYTVGYVPFLRTYPGAATPQPIEILEHHGDSAWDVVLREVLALTKMNWNTADFSCAKPMTLAFAQRVGQILAEIKAGDPRPEYRFYM